MTNEKPHTQIEPGHGVVKCNQGNGHTDTSGLGQLCTKQSFTLVEVAAFASVIEFHLREIGRNPKPSRHLDPSLLDEDIKRQKMHASTTSGCCRVILCICVRSVSSFKVVVL